MHSDHLASVRARIAQACRKTGRDPAEVTLLAVSKLHPASAVEALYACGQRSFGENRLQEALPKLDQLRDLEIDWHFIGPVQSNKTRDVAARFDWVQSVDREKILRRLATQRPAGLPPLNVCLQVNIDHEPQKAGLEPAELEEMTRLAEGLERIRLRGLMCIPRLTTDRDATRRSFAATRSLFQRLRASGHALDTLSMGMSADLELAIEAGSTMVRVGTDLFGKRPDE